MKKHKVFLLSMPFLLFLLLVTGCGSNGSDAQKGLSEESFSLIQSISEDGGENGDDEPRGIAIDESGTVYVTGYVTVTGTARDIWLAKYDANLVFQDSITLSGSANSDDEGYGIAFDQDGYLYVIGYMSETGEDHNVWLAKFDSNLVLQNQITVNGSENSTDDGYGIIFDEMSGYLYVAGTLREVGEGYNIWIGKYDTDLNLQTSTTLNGPDNNTDKGRFLTFDNNGNLFVSGSATQAGTGYDIWIGKFDQDLNLLDERIVAGPTADEDKGYGLIFDGMDTIYITGTITEAGQGYNIWLAKYDTDLNLLDSTTLNGPVDGDDVTYSITMDENGYLYHTGVYSEVIGGANIWIAQYNTELELQASTTVNGSASGYDTGIGIVKGVGQDLYVSATIDDSIEGFNIWVGHYEISP